MKKYISRFHYLTQDLPDRTHLEQVQLACEAGANWIQYRCLTKTDEELVAEINQVAAVCDDWGTTLIITDHYHLLFDVDAQGVHIENMHADFKKIREQIGPDKTLGASANSFEDIGQLNLTNTVDYIGCGPFSVTQTKPNNFPLLGVTGYRNIMKKTLDENITTPIIAVGGIKIEDVEELMGTGIYGIAVSAAVNLADESSKAFKDFYRKLH
ncbi:thiamine phosphate synthase [Rubrolithibacter danxiaensis]|uniref:thiamine phosphate synthase n=1 Tax=Rubrolithibacter danxiaensis TaxID=3390805 RepID=UPI003BF90AB6